MRSASSPGQARQETYAANSIHASPQQTTTPEEAGNRSLLRTTPRTEIFSNATQNQEDDASVYPHLRGGTADHDTGWVCGYIIFIEKKERRA